MRTFVPGYYIIEGPKRKSWSEFTNYSFLLFNWALTFIARRAIINVALGPDEIRLQKPVHVIFFSDDRSEKGSVIVNLLPGKSSKAPTSYYDKLPRFSNTAKRQLSNTKPSNQRYIDSIINEIGLLLEGRSTQEKCRNKQFSIEDIHIKGIERLDDHLANYFKEQMHQKYGKAFFERPRKVQLNFYTLETADHAVLESVEIPNTDEELKPMSERKFVISCMARNQNYMYWLKDLYTSAKHIGCTVIGFNYRGLDYSKGMIWTYKNLVDDALSQARRLIESGVKPENIAFEGMSMGAAVATITAAKMHENGLRVKLYNERSYRSLLRLMIGYIMPDSTSNPWNPLTWLNYVAVGCAYLFLTPAICLLGWHLDAANAWDRIPFAYKIYSVARNHQNPAQPDDDDLVHDSFSSIASLMAQHLEEIKYTHQNGGSLSIEEQQMLADKPESHEFTLDRNNAMNTNPSNHSAPRRFLVDTQSHQQTMHTYMIEHVREMLEITPPGLEAHINKA
ncbi:alpha/beta hydrolase family protein [Legionella waltersii]|uniref:SdbA protein, substrate of the Dot/Icm system n=1 Tax=Legionella waltersii TaxID=66969 RepID=A0A0W1AM18_9GAMM|nr:alpha/beta hydrolase [Legionella waltersii]KTD82211.1 SdbA protein, substrate of the Dot/Icm system [Legionella waltersii]SNV10744.1 SdbA protein, substrate of the Dot/Icm system [Legionella waltersii]